MAFEPSQHLIPSVLKQDDVEGIDQDDRVIYLGTFSKAVFSALRLAYVIVPEDLITAFRAARLAAGGPPPMLEQAVMASFMSQGHYTRHLRRLRRVYAKRQRRLVEAVQDELSGIIEVTPDGNRNAPGRLDSKRDGGDRSMSPRRTSRY